MSTPTMPLRDSSGELIPHVLVELELSSERMIVLAGCTPDELADLAERLRALKREREQAVKATADTIGEVEHELLSRLAPGEVVMAKSTGRFAYNGPVAAGKATIKPEAFDELREQLPPELRPQTQPVYPGVGDVRKAKRKLRELGISLRALLNEPGKVPGLRWRTLDDEPEDES